MFREMLFTVGPGISFKIPFPPYPQASATRKRMFVGVDTSYNDLVKRPPNEGSRGMEGRETLFCEALPDNRWEKVAVLRSGSNGR